MKIVKIIILVLSVFSQGVLAQISGKSKRIKPEDMQPINKSLLEKPIVKQDIISTPVSSSFPQSIRYQRFSLSNYKAFPGGQPKGAVLLTHYSAYNYDVGLLNTIGALLAAHGVVVVVIAHRADRASGWATDSEKLITDFKNVFSHLQSQYTSITTANSVAGGWSYTGQILGSSVYSDNWVKQLRGLVLISAGGKEWGNVPIINKVCKDDPVANDPANGNFGGEALQQKLQANLPAIAGQSYCETDYIHCSGHQFSDTWASFFVEKLKLWYN